MAGAESKKRKRPDEVEQGGQDDCHSSSKLISLNSSDGKVFKIEEDVALQFGTLKPLLDDESSDINSIISAPPNIDSNILSKVVDYCKKHAEKDVDLKPFDRDFLQGMDQDVLFRITQAAHYFEIESLLDLTSHEIARLIKGMTVGKVRKFFNIINDIPFEVENNFHKEFAWAFENLDDSAPQEVQPGPNYHGPFSKICGNCRWAYPNKHPSQKARTAHKKVCGTLPGWPVVDQSERSATGKYYEDGSPKLLFDIQCEVLKRLPVKSLIRFMIACKQWNCQITSSRFISVHLWNKVLVCYNKHRSSGDIKGKCISISDDDSFPDDKNSITLPKSVRLLKGSVIVGSVNGLFCFAHYSEPHPNSPVVVLWNPTTRQSVVITSQPELHEEYCKHTYFLGFGVCSRTNNPKIVTVSDGDYWERRGMRSCIDFKFDTLPDRVRVYSLRSRVWRKPFGRLPLSDKEIELGFSERVFTSEFMYFLGHGTWASDPYLIISFDITKEQFSEVPLPSHLADRTNKLSLSKLRDSLILKKRDAQSRKDVVWVMEKNDPKTVKRLFTLNSPDQCDLLAFRMNGQAVIQNKDEYDDVVFVYDPESEGITSVEISGHISSMFGDLFVRDHVFKSDGPPIFASSYCETLFLSSENAYSKHHLMICYKTGDGARNCISFVDDDALPSHKKSLTFPTTLPPTSCLISGSSQGIFCVQSFAGGFPSAALLWNPTFNTSVTIDLPRHSLDREVREFKTILGFGVCPLSMDPKVVMITYNHLRTPEESFEIPNQVQIYTLSSGSWRPPHRSSHLPRKSMEFKLMEGGHVVTNKFIYWLVLDRRYPNPVVGSGSSTASTNVDDTCSIIISFDIETEEFAEIRLPDSLADSPSLRLFNQKDAIVLVTRNQINSDKAWIMHESEPGMFKELFTVNTSSRVLGFTKNSEPVIGTHLAGTSEISVYEPNSYKISSIGIKEAEIASVFVGSYIETNLLIQFSS